MKGKGSFEETRGGRDFGSFGGKRPEKKKNYSAEGKQFQPQTLDGTSGGESRQVKVVPSNLGISPETATPQKNGPKLL